jgi:hypothetical protein
MASEFPKDTIGQPPSGGMIDRIKRLLLTPKDEWPRIDAEPMDAKGVFMKWAVPLAAIGPVCGLIGGQVFGINLFLIHYRPPFISSLVTAVLTYAAALAGIWLIAFIIDALAPTFNGVKNFNNAMKVAAFSYTAAWIAGVFQIVPALAIIGALAGLYSFYLLWVGLPVLMKCPPDKSIAYVLITIVCAFVVYLIIGLVVASITTSMLMPATLGTPGAVTLGGTTVDGGQVTVPGAGSVDLGKLNEAANKIKAAGESMQASVDGKPGGVKAVDPNALQAMLPGAIAGYNRTSIESSGGGAAGINGSNARGEYQAGDKNISMSITDMGAMGNLATLGGALNVQSSKQTATGYEKTQMVDGRMVNEKWDNQSKSGTYGVMVGSRFMVEANGSAPDIDTLKSAVAAINLGQLEALAK